MLTIVAVLGIVLVVLHRDRAPTACRVAAVSLGALLVVSYVEPAFEWTVYSLFGSRQQGGLLVSNSLRLAGWLFGALRAASIGGLALSVLLDRGVVFDRQSPLGRQAS